MSKDHNSIYSIVERLAVLEGRITPSNVKSGLNAEQKSVNQLPALFKPKNITPTLDKKSQAAHPMKDYFVGEGAVEEDVLSKGKRGLLDYLASIADERKDSGIRDKATGDADIKDKIKKDLTLIAKEITTEDPTEEDPVVQAITHPIDNPTYAESPAALKTIALEDGRICEIHGHETTGFEVRHGDRILKTKFKNLEEAEIAMEMFRSGRRSPPVVPEVPDVKIEVGNADYIEER